MSKKRSLPPDTLHQFSCQLCYRRKVKCDRGNPCTYCVRHKVECEPSPVEISNRPRKQRFPEAELLSRIRKYENALLSYGADLEAIKGSSDGMVGEVETSSSPSTSKSYSGEPLSNIVNQPPVATHPNFELDQVLTILDGGGTAPINDTNRTGSTANFLDKAFENDGSFMLFTVDTKVTPHHPEPFDIFKLWQIYCDNVHPINKTIHVPTFQRKISTYGSHLNLAPASDQALFFAVYLTALSSLTAEECEAIFFATKQSLISQYKLGTQVWLRRAGLWRTTELSVLQAFLLFLSTFHNTVDPRSLVTFTGMADRIARRMGLHRDDMVRGDISPLDQQMRKRVWWELYTFDTRTSEKAGMGSNVLAPSIDVGLPSDRSDADIESLQGAALTQNLQQPSSEMVFFLIRSEAALFLSHHRNDLGSHHRFKSSQIAFSKKVQLIDDFERWIQSRYLSICDESLPHHRMAISAAKIIIARIRISPFIIEEASRTDLHRGPIQNKLLEQCVITLEQTNKIRNDPTLHRFEWFMHQHMPIFALIHTLRLLQILITGPMVDRAWQAVEIFKENGLRLHVDSLILKAWKVKRANMSGPSVEEPGFIKIIEERESSSLKTQASTNEFTWTSPGFAQGNNSDYMSLLANMSNSVDPTFDLSSWLNENPVG